MYPSTLLLIPVKADKNGEGTKPVISKHETNYNMQNIHSLLNRQELKLLDK